MPHPPAPDAALEAVEPEPLTDAVARRYLARRMEGAAFRDAFEEALEGLDRRRADLLAQLSKESHGAWTLLLEGGTGGAGRALCVGNALWGGAAALAGFGWDVTLVDPSPSRVALAADVHGRHDGARVGGVAGGARLPFRDGAFDLVVSEEPGLAPPAELRRVACGEVAVLCDNRLGYKRSGGGYQDLHLRSPLDWLRSFLAPRRDERTLRGHRRALAGDGLVPRDTLVLYPDRRDFAQVVQLGERGPELQLGPGERRNRLKTTARALGLFPVLAPSCAIVATCGARRGGPSRIDRTLAALAERLGEPRPVPEHLIGTRGNTAVVHTRVAGADPDDPAGRWTLHFALHPPHRRGLERHLDFLRSVATSVPGVPVPEALFAGEAGGTWVSVERRLPGVAAHHLTGSADVLRTLLEGGAEHLARLAGPPASPLDEADLDVHVGSKLRFLRERLRDTVLLDELAGLADGACGTLRGATLPRVVQHGDLRSKHVQLAEDGRVLGYLDWGTASRDELPGFDLQHLVVHSRPRRAGERDAGVWRRLLAGDAPALELGVLERHRRDLGIEPDAWRALLALYPLRLAYVAESNWPYGRPGWMRTRFGM